MLYKDKTFCPFNEECANGNSCHRALTPEDMDIIVKENWQYSIFVDRPECFKNIEPSQG